MRVVADQQGKELVEVAKEAGAELVCATSLKATRTWIGTNSARRGAGADVTGVTSNGNVGTHAVPGRGRSGSASAQEMPFAPGGVVHFPQEGCAQCSP